MWRSVGNWSAYSSWRLGCKGARADKSPVTAFSFTSLSGILLMSKLCKDVRLLMAAGTGPCNPMFDKFLPHRNFFFQKQFHHQQQQQQPTIHFGISPLTLQWKISEISLWFLPCVCVCVERDTERERAAYKATIERSFKSQVTKLQLAWQGPVPGTHEVGISAFHALTTSNKASPAYIIMHMIHDPVKCLQSIPKLFLKPFWNWSQFPTLFFLSNQLQRQQQQLKTHYWNFQKLHE